MYSWKDFVNGLNDPHLFAREFNVFLHTRGFSREFNPRGVDVFARDWDNLIVLDACRAEAYRERLLPELEGDSFDVVESRGAVTEEWLESNFGDRKLHDTVYLTANARIWKMEDEFDLHAAVFSSDDLERGQEKQVEKALEVQKQFPDKRLVVHLKPPHTPYVGEKAEKHLPSAEVQKQLLTRIRHGEVELNHETLKDIYLDNVERMAEPVRKIVDGLEGRTVVTADHGEMLGERATPLPVREYGHITGLYTGELVRVPWHVFEGEERKDIVEEEPVDETRPVNEEEVKDYLKKLGYMN